MSSKCAYCGRQRNDSHESCPGCAATEMVRENIPPPPKGPPPRILDTLSPEERYFGKRWWVFRKEMVGVW